MHQEKFTWYEFFAGGGMARLGLGACWHCVFANEWCPKKAAAYRAYFGQSENLQLGDIRNLSAKDLPGSVDLAWASFPCQDLSLAGSGAGLSGERSGTFSTFSSLMSKLGKEGRAPNVIALENVVGTITSHKGIDFASILQSLSNAGYRVGALVLNAIRFLPQSRPRLFFIALRRDLSIPPTLTTQWPNSVWHPPALTKAYAALPDGLQKGWIWWNLPRPTTSIPKLSELIEDAPRSVAWNTPEGTQKLLSMMSEVNLRKVIEARSSGETKIGMIYKRTRPGENGLKTQRAEVRFDEISGCLRTPIGGSSRQTILLVTGRQTKSRLLSSREAARLMGVPESYPTPTKYNDAYHLFGDGVAVPVVSWLEKHLLRPLAIANSNRQVTQDAA